MSRSRRRRWPWVLLLAAACGGTWWWYSHREKKTTGPEYQTAVVTRQDLRRTVKAVGDLNPLQQVEIGSQISGTISELMVDFNSQVTEGDVLCKLDPATYQANYEQAAAERASAKAECDFQRQTFSRKKQLLAENLYAKADFDKAEADLRRAEAQLELAEARLRKAQVDLDRCTIFAPIDGIIIDRTAEIGQTIAASFNAPKLFIMANTLTEMQLNAKVSEAHIGQVEVGQPVVFTVLAYPGEEFHGEVAQVRNSPITEENVVNYDAIISVKNPELKLKPGMNAVVEIIVGERKDTLTVPRSALTFRPPSAGGREGMRGGDGPPAPGSGPRKPIAGATGEPYDEDVYVLPKGSSSEPVLRKVRAGLSNDVVTEILEGLEEGETVITLLIPEFSEMGAANNPFGGGMRRGGPRR